MSPFSLRKRLDDLTNDIARLTIEYAGLIQSIHLEMSRAIDPQRLPQFVEALEAARDFNLVGSDMSDLIGKDWCDISPARQAQWVEELEADRAAIESHLQTLRPLIPK